LDISDNIIIDNEIKNLIPYTDTKGRQPVIIWLESLDKITRTRINARFARIEQGNYGDFKSIGDEVFEYRFDFGSGYRIYFGEDGNNIVLLLLGGDKQTQNRDIKKAKEFWKDYKKRKEEF
jgi:putative addiction module killer protein